MEEEKIDISYSSPQYSGKNIFYFVNDSPQFKSGDWFPMDSKELFDRNCKNFPDNKSIQYYIENPIKYKFNSDYFRTYDNFDSKKEGNVYLGCSHTFGIGHHLENTWGYKLNKSIGGKFWNLGIPGGSIQSAFAAFAHYVNKLNVKNVFIYLPHSYRYLEFDYDGHPININTRLLDNSRYREESHLSKQSKFNYLTNEYSYLINYGYLNAIENICRKLNINCYFCNLIPSEWKGEVLTNDLEARDLAHLPTSFHEVVFKYFLEEIKKNKQLDSNKLRLNIL